MLLLYMAYITCNINKNITRYVRCLSVFITNFAKAFREYLLSLITRILHFKVKITDTNVAR